MEVDPLTAAAWLCLAAKVAGLRDCATGRLSPGSIDVVQKAIPSMGAVALQCLHPCERAR